MRSTLFISDSKSNYSKKISDVLAVLLGPGISIDTNSISKNINRYKNIVFTICIGSNYMAEETLSYIKDIKENLKNKKIAMLVILENGVNIEECKINIRKVLGKKPDILSFTINRVEEKVLLDIAHNIAKVMNKNSKKVDDLAYILEKLKSK
ncbi:hypothetical protein KQI30_14440 [Clostridium bornimense]|uniref:hypothetical protein n=1 Tax=Clostridium bornimense TaxID=1216932 RepID=UPI001C1194DF|nr:hypothetical protein [Clostridium bornimense]MBU5317451.1 hypothetical protein [Clostridium bornimense]